MRIALLMLATFIWGAGFVGTRWTMIDYTPIWSNSMRFVFAGILSIPFIIFRKNIKELKGAFLCSILLLIGLQLQTYGIKFTSLAKSGFLTTFYAIFTPIFSLILYRSKFSWRYWFLVAMAFLGIALLCDLEWSQFNKGDTYTLLSAIFFSLHILAIDKFGQHDNSIDFNFWQIFFISILGFVFAMAVDGAPDISPLLNKNALIAPSALWGFVILAVFSSLIAFSIQCYAQKGTPPHIVSLIFLTESVFSAIFGNVFFDEVLSFKGVMGALLVLLSVALIPLTTRYKKGPSARAPL